jgi:hypothetical protein
MIKLIKFQYQGLINLLHIGTYNMLKFKKPPLAKVIVAIQWAYIPHSFHRVNKTFGKLISAFTNKATKEDLCQFESIPILFVLRGL